MARGGRVVTCDWSAEGLAGHALLEHFQRFILTLGLQTLHVVACDDAVAVGEGLEADFPGVIVRSLYFPRNAPRGEQLWNAVQEFVDKS